MNDRVISVPAVALDAIEAVPDWCRLVKRSGTLDGTLQLRAARFCPPVVQGNAAGFQVWMEDALPFGYVNNELDLQLAPEVFRKVTQACPAAMAELVSRGLIIRNGYWHRLFKTSAIALKSNRMLLWTGILVRPNPEISLLVSRAFNRHSRVEIVDHLVESSDVYTPLVIEIDVRAIEGQSKFILQREIACVTPLRAGAEMQSTKLSLMPEIARSLVEHHDLADAQKRAKEQSGKYVRYKRPSSSKLTAEVACTVATTSPQQNLRVKQFKRFFDEKGISGKSRRSAPIPYAETSTVYDLQCHWDGRMFSRFEVTSPTLTPRQHAELVGVWAKLYGAGVPYKEPEFHKPRINEQPIMVYFAHAVCATPPEWVSIMDGYRFGHVWGMRGIVDTDWYPGVTTVLSFDGPTSLHIEPRTPTLRVLPVPRELLNSTMTRKSLSDLQA